jgi:uncharacterized repeat protein (TIGR03803 family)
MKAKLFIMPVLIAGLALIPAGQAAAQSLRTLHSFTGGSDGGSPRASLILSGNTLYGTASSGGLSGDGTVFSVNTDGTSFTILHDFTAESDNESNNTNSDGASPWGGLVLSGNTLYGTAVYGGSSGYGTVFAVNTDSTGFTTLYNFTDDNDGAYPYAGLILSGDTLYGTTVQSIAVSGGYGTVFAVNTDGTGFTCLYNFTGGSDGSAPFNGVNLSGNTLFGIAADGGNAGDGTVFSLGTDGTNFTTLYTFTNGSDGAGPRGFLLSGNTVYGMAANGGNAGHGTVWAVNTDGTGFTTLHAFDGTNGDGGHPLDGVILSGSTLYGTAGDTVFAVNTNGTGYTILHLLNNGSDGEDPWGGLILSANTLYGTAWLGGNSGNGTVFSLALPRPQLAIILSGANVVLTWTNTASGFKLQSASNLVPPAVWAAVSPTPVVINGQYTVTNPISATMFYRLSQ